MHLGRPRAFRWPASLAAVILLVALASACSYRDDVPLPERRAQAVNNGIMCPVCPGESIDQSQHPLAVQMRGIVVEKLEQGWTQAQINTFFVERYGPSVLLEPPRSGANVVAWLAPPLGVAAALGLLFAVMRRRLRTRAGEPGSGLADVRLSDAERAEYARRIEAGLDAEGVTGPATLSEREPLDS